MCIDVCLEILSYHATQNKCPVCMRVTTCAHTQWRYAASSIYICSTQETCLQDFQENIDKIVQV